MIHRRMQNEVVSRADAPAVAPDDLAVKADVIRHA